MTINLACALRHVRKTGARRLLLGWVVVFTGNLHFLFNGQLVDRRTAGLVLLDRVFLSLLLDVVGRLKGRLGFSHNVELIDC